MIPAYYVRLEKLPLTSNGKINRKALPEPDGNIYTGVEYKEAETQTEKLLVNMWKEMLMTEKIGINDNFFDKGGNSLLAIGMQNRINNELNKEISVVDLFKYPTISAMSKFIDEGEDNDRLLKNINEIVSRQKAVMRVNRESIRRKGNTYGKL